jgi:hypothetical protein
MQIDFSELNLNERPRLILRNLDFKAIAVLGYAYDITASVNFCEVSELEFKIPSHHLGKEVPYFDKVVGMRLIDIPEVGVFILVDPSVESDGIETIKTCKAYSREYEFTYKKITLEESTYRFYSPLDPTNTDTVIGMILELMPDWSVGSIDSVLQTKARTFTVSDENLYNFIKDTVEDSFGCIFHFDTRNLTINVVSTANDAVTEPVYLSFKNLVQEITVEENSDDIITCITPYGADELSISYVNATGNKKLYNLDYFMTTENFEQSFIDKWNNWKETYTSYQDQYYTLSIGRSTAQMEYELAQADILATETVLDSIRASQQVWATYYAQLKASSTDVTSAVTDTEIKIGDVVYFEAGATITEVLERLSNLYSEYETTISTKTAEREALYAKVTAYQAQCKAINAQLAFSAFFTDEEVKLIKRYIKEDTMEDSTFVASDIVTYADSTVDSNLTDATIKISCVGTDDDGNEVSLGSIMQINTGSTSDSIATIEKLQAEIEASNISKINSDKLQEYQEDYEYYQETMDEVESLGIDLSVTVYGNIDTNNRQILEWTEENLATYKSAIESWGSTVDEMRGSFSTVFGGSSEFDGVEIAFSPMLQSTTGAILLDQDTVYEYINRLISKAGENWTTDTLLRLDAIGLTVNRQTIKNLIADVGDSAILTGEAMHYTGNTGAVAIAYSALSADADEAGMSVDALIYYLQTANGQYSIITSDSSVSSKAFYKITGGKLSLPNMNSLTAEVISGVADFNVGTDSSSSDYRKIVATLYLGSGSIVIDGVTTEFPTANLTISGVYSNCACDAVLDTTTSADGETGALSYGTYLNFTVSSAIGEFTQQVTEYQARAVEWELMEYANEVLLRKAYPTYTFKLTAANFLHLSQFEAFKKELQLGHKVYIEYREGEVLEPILVGMSWEYDDPTSLELTFGDTYYVADGAFQLVDLLDQSVSMGHKLDLGQYSYNAYRDSGAENAVYNFMTSALNAAQNAVVNSSNQEVRFDEHGILLRKSKDGGSYEDTQIWLTNNMIAFTGNSWETAEMAIGTFNDSELGKNVVGVVAQNVVGTLLAGQSLVVTTDRTSFNGTEQIAEFRMDSDGCRLFNSSFDIYSNSTGGLISLNPDFGVIAGQPSANWGTIFDYDENGNVVGVKAASVSSSSTIETMTKVADILNSTTNKVQYTPKANFWLDMYGDAYFKGTVIADNGIFNGTVYATDGEFTGTVTATGGSFTGDIYADDGYFSGTVKAAKLSGSLTSAKADDDDAEEGWLDGLGIRVGTNSSVTPGYNFYVDTSGNVYMQGNLTLSSGAIAWEALSSDVQDAIEKTVDVEAELRDSFGIVTNSKNITSTRVSGTKIESPEIVAANLYGADIYGGNIYALELGSGESWDGYADGTYTVSSTNYTQMSSNGLTTFLNGTSKTFLGQSEKLAELALPQDSYSYCPTLRLGYGSNGQSYVFVIQKDGQSNSGTYTHYAYLGLKFSANGKTKEYTVDVIGTMTGLGTATAVFG